LILVAGAYGLGVPDPAVLLLPSPLVGSATWRSVAASLGQQGREAAVVETGAPRHPAEVIAAVLDAAAGLGQVTLVPHSNAGLYVAALRERLDVVATVFVDAALPDGDTETAMAPPGLMSRLRELADPDGVLPPWTRWWGSADLAELFPSEDARDLLERTQPRLPLSYFTARLPVPDGWTEMPSAFLAFGDTYSDEVALALAHRWPISVLPGRHLQMLHDPVGVAVEVLRLEALLRQ
jgi:hypothetical protein